MKTTRNNIKIFKKQLKKKSQLTRKTSIQEIQEIQKIKEKQTKLVGGRFLSKGSFGCVIKPALPCPNSTKKIDLNKHISKLIGKYNDKIDNELTISNILNRADKNKKYFIPFVDNCQLKSIPNSRTNIAQVKYWGEKANEYDLIDKRNYLDPTYCNVDFDLKPINLIMQFGGYDLDKVINYKSRNIDNKVLPIIREILFSNFKKYIKHLLLGLIIMHSNRIVNRDIKQKNIVLGLNKDFKTLQVKYIDFGLSEFLSTEYVRHYENIHIRGTPVYIPPELFAVSTIYKNFEYDDEYVKKKFFDNSNVKITQLCSAKKLGLPELYDNYLNFREELYWRIKKKFDNNTILQFFFGTQKNKFNGYLQKADVYGLGACIYESILDYKLDEPDYKVDPLLIDLIMNMLEIDPAKRFNAVQALNHPYLK
jgi:serine/threonine protein kinase